LAAYRNDRLDHFFDVKKLKEIRYSKGFSQVRLLIAATDYSDYLKLNFAAVFDCLVYRVFWMTTWLVNLIIRSVPHSWLFFLIPVFVMILIY